MNPFGKYISLIVLLVLIIPLIGGCRDNIRISEILGGESGSESETAEEPEPDPEELWLRLWTEIDHRDYYTAGETLAEVEALPDAQDHTLKYARAFLLGRTGQHDDSLEILNELNPSKFQPSILVLRGITLVSMHRLDEARSDMEMAESSSFYQPAYVLYVLWTLDHMEGKFESAREIEDILRRHFGTDSDAARVIFEAALLRRDFASAGQALERETLLPPDDVLGRSPDPHYWPLILMDRARLAYTLGDLDRAIDILEGITREYPNTTSAWPTLTWLGHISGRIDEAELWALEGLLRSGGIDTLHELNIEIPEQFADLDVSRFVPVYNSAAKLLILLGHCYLGNGDVDRALDCADRAIDLCRYEEGAYYLKGRAYEVTGDIESALETLAEGIRTAPEDERLPLRYVILANRRPDLLNENLPDPAEIRDEILNLLEARHSEYPVDPDTAEMLAELVQHEDVGRAVELLAIAYETVPTRLDFALDYAAVLAETGEVDRAKEILNDLPLPPDLPWLHDLYCRAAIAGSADLIDLADWATDIMDPDNGFAPYLDTVARSAREAIVDVEKSESAEPE